LKVYLFEFWGSFCGEVRNGNFLQFYPSRNMKKMNLHESVSVKIGFVVCSREVSEIGVTNLKRKKNKKVHARVIFHLFAFTGAIALNFGAPDG